MAAGMLDVEAMPGRIDAWLASQGHHASVISYDADGIPYMAPEIVLLFKAKGQRAKDEADFRGALPLLDGEQRRWLNDALDLVHPSHPWRAFL